MIALLFHMNLGVAERTVNGGSWFPLLLSALFVLNKSVCNLLQCGEYHTMLLTGQVYNHIRRDQNTLPKFFKKILYI